MSANPVLETLKHVWSALAPLQAPMAVMGGLALATWKHPRATRDVDLLIEMRADDVPAVLQHLRASGLRPKRDPPTVKLDGLTLLQLLYAPPESFMDVQVDLLLAESAYHRAALANRTPMDLPAAGLAFAVLTCEDLILHKLLAGRLIDRADAAALVRVNRAALNRTYLADWAARLNLSGPLAEAWGEAW